MFEGRQGRSSDRSPLTRADRAALLSAFHHSGEIVVPNTFLPSRYRVTSMKEVPGRLSSEARDVAVQATARGVSAALAGRSRATPAYRHGNLSRLLGPGKEDPFAAYVRAPGGENPPGRGTVEETEIPKGVLQPDDWQKRVGHIPGGTLDSRDTVGQGPYLTLLARQLGIEPNDFPIVLHTHDAWPDLDTFVTSVVIRLIISREKLKGKIDWLDHFSRCLNPARWAEEAKDYFEGSSVSPGSAASADGWTGQLDEKVFWALNDAFTSRTHNRLNIAFSVDEDKDELKVAYSLAESISSDVAGSAQRGGLDVDDGEVVMWSSADKAYFNIVATKQVRFVNRDAPPLPGGVNLGEFLNFMAPAAVGLWMDSLVFQTALGAIEAARGKDAAAARLKDEALGNPKAALPVQKSSPQKSPPRRGSPGKSNQRRGPNGPRQSLTP
jgi:hypothetical protein